MAYFIVKVIAGVLYLRQIWAYLTRKFKEVIREKMENETFRREFEIERKRPYRKPLVQIYGTLKDMTQSMPNTAAHAQDNPAPLPPPAPGLNRT